MANKSHTALLLIDNQLGFQDPTHWGPARSNPFYESNAISLLSAFRALSGSDGSKPLIIHVQHASLSPTSILHPDNPGYGFLPWATPQPGEPLIVKNVNSAFIGTRLEELLKENKIWKLVIAGLTTDHCVSTTTRMAGNLQVTRHLETDQDGNESFVDGEVIFVEDATAAWEKPGSRFDAETVHAVHAESLKEFATVKKTAEVLKEL